MACVESIRDACVESYALRYIVVYCAVGCCGVCMYVRMYVCAYVCMYVCMFVCVCVCCGVYVYGVVNFLCSMYMHVIYNIGDALCRGIVYEAVVVVAVVCVWLRITMTYIWNAFSIC